jgi:hypothetical protein
MSNREVFINENLSIVVHTDKSGEQIVEFFHAFVEEPFLLKAATLNKVMAELQGKPKRTKNRQLTDNNTVAVN